MSIKQFNGEWVAREDRILFRFNTSEGQEFRFWLTRHIVKNIIGGCQTLAQQMLAKEHPPEVAQAMQEFRQQSVMQQANFQDTFEAQPEAPLGEAPVLVVGLKITQTGQQVSIDFETASGHNVNLRITDDVLQLMVGLLDRLQTTAGWGVSTTSGMEVTVETAMPASAVVH